MIEFVASSRLFNLHTHHTTYQFLIDPNGFLLHTYYGRRCGGDSFGYLLRQADRGFSPNPREAGRDRTFSLDTQPQEFPAVGVGDFRTPVLEVENADGSCAADLRYVSHTISSGKYALEGLPAFYGEEGEAETLEVLLRDPWTGLEATLYYGVFPQLDLITRAVRFQNGGSQPIALTRAMSACLDLGRDGSGSDHL